MGVRVTGLRLTGHCYAVELAVTAGHCAESEGLPLGCGSGKYELIRCYYHAIYKPNAVSCHNSLHLVHDLDNLAYNAL
jgi:hypothetical protein